MKWLRYLAVVTAVAHCLWALPAYAMDPNLPLSGPDPLLTPPDPHFWHAVPPGFLPLKVECRAADGAQLCEVYAQIARGYWIAATTTTETEAIASMIVAGGPPDLAVDPQRPLILAGSYRVPMPSVVARVYLWPCVPGARYCVWVGSRRFSGTVRLDPRARE